MLTIINVCPTNTYSRSRSIKALSVDFSVPLRVA